MSALNVFFVQLMSKVAPDEEIKYKKRMSMSKKIVLVIILCHRIHTVRGYNRFVH